MIKVPGLSSVKPTSPGITINNKYLRAGLRGEAHLPKGLGQDHNWHVSNLPRMKMDKSAKLLSDETKTELLSTGVIGAAGAATSALAHKVMSTGVVKNTAGRAALIGGGLGLIGDYAAVKVNNKLNDHSLKSKHMNKQATFNALMDSGVSYDLAVALVKQAESGDAARGFISPAWMESHIAAKHGKEGPTGAAQVIGSHLNGSFRAAGRAVAEGAAGAGLGAGAGMLAASLAKKEKALAAAVGGVAGYYGGSIHGAYKSLSNQAKEMHKKYS